MDLNEATNGTVVINCNRTLDLGKCIESAMNYTNSSSQVIVPSFEDPDAATTFGFWLNGVGITLIGLMGIFGNIASIRVLSHKQMRSSVNFILIALASSDLVVIITSILIFGWTTVYPYNGHLKDYFFVYFPRMCLVLFPLAIIAQTISIFMTFLISLERFIAVCHPLKARSYCTQAHTKFSIFAIVLFAVIYNAPKFFEMTLVELPDDDYGTVYRVSASWLRRNATYIAVYIHWMYFIIMNFIPLVGITFFNVMIYRQVQIVNRSRMKLTSKELQDIKLTTMLFCVVIVFLSCNFLAVLTNILETYHIHNDRLTKISNFAVTLNSSVNFIIYVVLVRKFRTIFIRQFKAFFRLHDDKGRLKARYSRQQTISRTMSSSDSETATTNETA